MSRMGAEYIRQMEHQFGDVVVANDAPCRDCGQPYGDHQGLECPEYGQAERADQEQRTARLLSPNP